MNEKKYHEKACFITLTYDEKNLPENGTLEKSDIQKFLKRLRKQTGKKVRYYVSGEYGDNLSRPHYHAILFGFSADDHDIIRDIWNKGHIFMGNVTTDSCNYVAKYVVKNVNGNSKKQALKKGVIPEFAIMSRKPGIGRDFVEDYKDEIYNRGFMIVKGNKAPIPRYYIDKIYDDDIRKTKRAQELEEHAKKIHEKVLDNITKKGYKGNDKEIVDERDGRNNILKDRINLKGRKDL